MKVVIKLKRVYQPVAKDDGVRILVDRIWPRGLSKSSAAVNIWCKEIAPSSSLRKWFKHDPEKWDAFKKRYIAELKGKEPLINELVKLGRDKGVVTLLFGARSEEFNQAVVLREVLLKQYG